MERIEVNDMCVNVRGKKDLKNFLFSSLIVEVESSLSPQTLEGVISLAKKYCFVSNTVSKSCPIEYIAVQSRS